MKGMTIVHPNTPSRGLNAAIVRLRDYGIDVYHAHRLWKPYALVVRGEHAPCRDNLSTFGVIELAASIAQGTQTL